MMEFLNFVENREITKKTFSEFMKILFPFAPHLSQEIWVRLKNKGLLDYQKWPEYQQELIKEFEKKIIIQINGKKRDEMNVSLDLDIEEIKEMALERERVKKFIKDKKVKKVIWAQEKILNLVVE